MDILNSMKVTALFVVEGGKPVGVIHVHDLCAQVQLKHLTNDFSRFVSDYGVVPKGDMPSSPSTDSGPLPRGPVRLGLLPVKIATRGTPSAAARLADRVNANDELRAKL